MAASDSLVSSCPTDLKYGNIVCPFLRNIAEPTVFCFSGSRNNALDLEGSKGPIFEDGPSFDSAFKMFHGSNGVVPLQKFAVDECSICPFADLQTRSIKTVSQESEKTVESDIKQQFSSALAASTATISLSSFGPLGGPFSYEAFKAAQAKKKKQAEREKNREREEMERKSKEVHQAQSDDWIATGKCPIAKTVRAFNGFIPLVAKMIIPKQVSQMRCPAAIVAARAFLAKTPPVKALRPKALPVKILAIGALGLGLNIPLGVLREHCEKFSPQWVLVVHAAVPFIAMLRKAVLMPKYAMAFTVASCVIGQSIGAKFERKRIKSAVSSQSAVKGLPPIDLTKQNCGQKGGVDDRTTLTVSSQLGCLVRDTSIFTSSYEAGEVTVC